MTTSQKRKSPRNSFLEDMMLNYTTICKLTQITPYPSITLTLSSTNIKIFNEHSFLYISIKVETYRSNKPAQCFSCQRFRHFSLYCGYAPRCVNCASPHMANDCPKTRDEDPKGVNFEGSRIANYTKCLALINQNQ